MQYTNQGDPAQEDTEQNKRNAQIRATQHRTQTDKNHNAQIRAMQRAGNRLQGKGEVTIWNGGDDSTGTPLTVEEATTASGLKPLEENG